MSATTNVSGRDDSGGNGNWATDTFVRSLTVTRHEAAAVSNCGGGVPSCWYYTGTLSDSGTFTTDTGAYTPDQGGAGAEDKITGTLSQLRRGLPVAFYTSSSLPDTSVMPSSVTGNSPSTGAWYEQCFRPDIVHGRANLIDWSSTYNAPATSSVDRHAQQRRRPGQRRGQRNRRERLHLTAGMQKTQVPHPAQGGGPAFP